MKKLTGFILFLHIFCSFAAYCAQSICIVIPAYNEQDRILNSLRSYSDYFDKYKTELTVDLLIVTNNCSDKTVPICKKFCKKHKNVTVLDIKPGGKGLAVKTGYLKALEKPYDYIGFVDADMATKPEDYHELIKHINGYDGIIASRYIKGATVYPKRPFIKKIGGAFYNWMLRKKLGLPYKDTQCGAKIFTYDTIKKVAPQMTENGWAFDLELLYLCNQEGKGIKEFPTIWSDQPGSHIVINRKVIKEFVNSPTRIKKTHEKDHPKVSRHVLKKDKKKHAKNKK